MENNGLEIIKDLLGKTPKKKLPAYQWQQLALDIINQLNIPSDKRNSVFLACKKYPRQLIEKCLNDTKELCQTGEKWKYFFKLINKNETTKTN